MNKVSCGVDTCSYYKSNECCAERINIAGKSASNAENTKCGTFLEKAQYSNLTNNTNSNDQTFVTCNADTCKHNQAGNRCELKNIQVSPLSDNPVMYYGTYCDSFEK
ncbi:MAG: DUF1540 domain-containing protein [Clostridioides sp.]|jgi:hypothetical protein|nr:DUF1540 domain-containing protein [Clostridioides sp.]